MIDIERTVPTGTSDARLWLCGHGRTWLGPDVSNRREFHATLPGYQSTPLRSIPDLAERLGVGTLLVKDESRRFGLPSFKILGASWGVYQALCNLLDELPSKWSTLEELREYLAPVRDTCLLTATAGNHGRAVARMARWLELRCLVLVPAALDTRTVQAIRSEGAQVRAVQGSYDDAVAQSAALAHADPSYVMVQDTAWSGYEQVPAWIVEGYDTLFQEIDDTIRPSYGEPDLVVVPAGVGSLLSAAIRHYHAPGRPGMPAVLSVEPRESACVLASVRAGRMVSVHTENVRTVMAGLNAGTVSTAAWPGIQMGLDAAVSVADDSVVRAQADLDRIGVQAGPCGSAALAGVTDVLTGEEGATVRQALGITRNSVIVLISTDGLP